jgi:DUF4097 and DUF4098 domain-containing protein YvlB
MRRFQILTLATLAAAISSLAAEYRTEEKEAIRRTLSGSNSLDVDLVSGTIEVTGDSGNTIRVEGERIIRADDKAGIDRAKKEVALDINQKDGISQLYENGPYRDHDGNRGSDNHGFHEHNDRRYSVAYNLNIKVPRNMTLRLHSVNGSLKAIDTAGKFDLKTINGKIDMTGIAGSGSADALNGATTVTFRENPKADSFFKSFNGRVDITFQANLNADFRLKTFNGGAYTDFDGTALASLPGTSEQKNGRFVYKSRGEQGLRVGNGGPEIRLETFNGDIRIHKQ